LRVSQISWLEDPGMDEKGTVEPDKVGLRTSLEAGENTKRTRAGGIMTVERLLEAPNQFFRWNAATLPYTPTLRKHHTGAPGADAASEIAMSAAIDPGIRGNATAARSRPDGTPRRKQEGGSLFQGFFAASMLLHNVVEAMPVRSLERQPLGNALRFIRRVLEEGRAVLQDLLAPEFAPYSIEQELSGFLKQFSTGVVRCEVSVSGHRRELKPAIQEQINLIAREALVNALLHSEATCIEAEVEYLRRRLRVVVRDNGRGINPQKAWTPSDAHWALLGMRDRAESMGANLTIWSRPGAGTEVEISITGQAFVDACASAAQPRIVGEL
jgi:anti-sigma regulatory factor (Ser/Thr protein kinase)